MSSPTDAELTARRDGWASVIAGFLVPAELSDGDITPLDLDASSRAHAATTFATLAPGSISRLLADMARVLDGCSLSTMESAARKEAHLQRLQDEESLSDDDESGTSLTQDERMQKRYANEESRLEGLLKDKQQSPLRPVSPSAEANDVAAPETDGQYLMSGALDPRETGYLPTAPGAGGLVLSEGVYDAEVEAQNLSVLHDQKRRPVYTRPAPTGAASGLDLFMRLPVCVDEGGGSKQTAGQQKFGSLNKIMMPPCWRKKLKGSSQSGETVDTQTSGLSSAATDPEPGSNREACVTTKEKHHSADLETATIKSCFPTRHRRSAPPPPPKDILLSVVQVELELTRKLQSAAYEDDEDQKRSAAHMLRERFSGMFKRRRFSA